HIFEPCLNKKGGEAVLIDNFIYNFHSFNEFSNTYYWRCAQGPCRASATTFEDLAKLNGKEHLHDGLTDVDLKIMRKIMLLKEQALYTDTPIPKLYFQERSDLISQNVDCIYLSKFFPKLETLQKTLYRFRNSNMPQRAKNIESIVLDNEFIVCQDGKSRFLLFDTNDTDRIIAIASNECLNILSKSASWHIDGTFKAAPEGFVQVFTIHAWLMEQMFACVYILLRDKKEITYNKMLICLRDRLLELGFTISPTKITTDFELASINAFSRQFGVKLKGCHFHFLQAVRRAIDTNGLKIEYKKQHIQKVFKMWMALSFVPLNQMSEAIEIVIKKKDELYALMDEPVTIVQQKQTNILILARGRGTRATRARGRGRENESISRSQANLIEENTQRGRGRGRGRGRARGRGVNNRPEAVDDTTFVKAKLESFFDYFISTWFEGSIEYEMWNHCFTEGPRTNNHLEGYHAKINRWLDKNHPDIYKLITFFKMLDCNTVIEYNSRLTGTPAPEINDLTR
ncbi:unnamed protein product, partial [Brachionus calyciflorus]